MVEVSRWPKDHNINNLACLPSSPLAGKKKTLPNFVLSNDEGDTRYQELSRGWVHLDL